MSAIGEVESNLKAEQENMYEYKAQKGSLKLFERTLLISPLFLGFVMGALAIFDYHIQGGKKMT